ncbi:MAG TPA: polyprenyl synthetase family protein, partial [Pirellulales bacterium]|nr:polyprenyl synthetase family protein [Pirellulales bacterium]
MATAPMDLPLDRSGGDASAGGRRRLRQRSTRHLKLVPETKELRVSLRQRCIEAAEKFDLAHPVGKEELEAMARATLEAARLGEGYVGWTMVALASAFWQPQVSAVPFNRRLFLLPHRLKHAEGCQAEHDKCSDDDQRVDCSRCPACAIDRFRARAEALGYHVLVGEGSPAVLKIIVGGQVDAICGVACLDILEKAIDKFLLAGIPCMAIPLLAGDGRNAPVDEDWVMQMIESSQPDPKPHTKTYVHLMRAAANLFEPNELERLIPRTRGGARLSELNGQGIAEVDPIAATETIAYDFLSKGGKHSRPFITLAVHDAMTGSRGTAADGAQFLASIPAAIKRTAASIETFHKASLVHDDIEDDDEFRYGEPTVHRRFGTATAINVGDYLIGLGYRLVSRDAVTIGSQVASDIVDRLADAHMKLSEGQGAELMWRDARDKRLAPADALKIYALKTAPAFEAALYSGLRMAGPVDTNNTFVNAFARHMGVAFQILNDLNDWRDDSHNKLASGGDVLGGRPTVLWALALEGLDDAGRAELQQIVAAGETSVGVIARVRELYKSGGVFEKASRLVDKYQERAEAVANEVEPAD